MRVILRPVIGDALDATDTMYPSRLEVLSGTFGSEQLCMSYCCVMTRRATFTTQRLTVAANAGAFFCTPDDFTATSDGNVAVIRRYGFRGLTSAGTLESVGRLSFIDGCSDSILVMPPRKGDPVLNFLHIPAGVEQSLHIHSSIRLGAVVRGEGIAWGISPNGEWSCDLEAGSVFLLSALEVHAFRATRGTDLNMIVFHPDSDWGPSDDTHPMVNRSHIVRAAQ